MILITVEPPISTTLAKKNGLNNGVVLIGSSTVIDDDVTVIDMLCAI